MKKATLYIDARDFQKVRDGKSRVCTEWIQAAMNLDWTPWEICLLTQEELLLPDGVGQKIIPARSLFWHWQVHRFLAKQAKTQLVAYFSLNSYFGPVFSRGAYPTAILVHDLIALLHPKSHALKARWIEGFLLKRASRFAEKIFCVSQATQKDLSLYLADEKITSKIQKFPLSISKNQFFPKEVLDTESMFNHAYLLFVGNPIPRKNLDFILRAMHETMRETLPTIHLIVTGAKQKEREHYEKLISQTFSSLKGRVHFLGTIDTASLRRYYQEAHALVFPSLYEGFGLPIIEAMACGCPVIYHDASSMKEIAQNAGLAIPLQEKELEAAILSLFDTETRVIWKRRALERASEFDWSESLHTFISTFLNDYVSRKENPKP